MHDSVYDVAGGDRRVVAFLRKTLTGLADSPDPKLRELAAGVLDGSLDLRQAMNSDVYTDSFTAASEDFFTYYDSLDEGERLALERSGREQLDTVLEEDEQAQTRR